MGWWPLPSRAGSDGRDSGGYLHGPSKPIGRGSSDAEGRFEIAVGAVLAQNTAWPKASEAVASLGRAGLLHPARLLTCDDPALEAAIASAGTYRRKARYLKALAASWPALDRAGTRAELLALSGIGPETADCILCYAWGEASFVADAYARRILSRMGFTPESAGYEATRAFAQDLLPADAGYLAEAHALLVEHAKRACRSKPRCAQCAVADSCGLSRMMVTGPSLT